MCGREAFKRNQPESHWPSDPSIPLLRAERERGREDECSTAELAATALHKSLHPGLSSQALSTAHKEKRKWKRIIKMGMFKGENGWHCFLCLAFRSKAVFSQCESPHLRTSFPIQLFAEAVALEKDGCFTTSLPTSVWSIWNKIGQRQPLSAYKSFSQINLSTLHKTPKRLL